MRSNDLTDKSLELSGITVTDNIKKVIEANRKPANSAKEKYEQLKTDYNIIKEGGESFVKTTIDHALEQSKLLGEYCGFTFMFWGEVLIQYMKEHLNK